MNKGISSCAKRERKSFMIIREDVTLITFNFNNFFTIFIFPKREVEDSGNGDAVQYL